MSTLTGIADKRKITDAAQLSGYFARFAKPRACMRVGLEAEFFGVLKATGEALPYEGPLGIEEVLKRLAANFQYETVFEKGRVIALKRDETMITLEPGGQIELSAPPVKNVFEIETQIQEFLYELRSIAEEMKEIAWLAVGMQPFSRLEEIAWVPKERYVIMRDYLGSHGSLSHHMMKRTATNQVNVDYLSEEHAMRNFRVAMGITSIVSAMFSHSGFSEGSPSQFLNQRIHIWNHTDPDRTGLLLNFLKPGRTFQDYLNYILDMPMLFVVRNEKWIPFSGISFRRFIQEGYEGLEATQHDFELHLSTAFPEVRLKQYLEIRGVDGQRPELIPAVAAFWKGILYDPVQCDRAWNLVSWASPEDFQNLHHEIPRLGLKARLGDKPVLEIARALVDHSCASLARQMTPEETRSECVFLDLIRKSITDKGVTPSEALNLKWNSEFGRNPARLIDYLQI